METYEMNELGEVVEKEPIPALEQYPYEDENGVKHDDLICHYAPDGKCVLQSETGEVYDKAIDVYPCKYTYFILDEQAESIDSEETDDV